MNSNNPCSLEHKIIVQTYERVVKDDTYDSGLGRRQSIGRSYNYSGPMMRHEVSAVLAKKRENPDQLLDYWLYELIALPKGDLDV